jgi:Rhodopirellula transposase DDE domain
LPISKKDQASQAPPGSKRLSMDCKATVKLGAFSRGGNTRGDYKASDHDFGGTEHYIPCGILDEDTAQLSVTFGSSAKTSDFLVDTLTAWWQGLSVKEHRAIDRGQLKMDNGPESSGVRTQVLYRMGQLVDTIGKPIQLLYYPPYHSKYNPIERCWGILELPWNGTQLHEVKTMLAAVVPGQYAEETSSMPTKSCDGPARGALHEIGRMAAGAASWGNLK